MWRPRWLSYFVGAIVVLWRRKLSPSQSTNFTRGREADLRWSPLGRGNERKERKTEEKRRKKKRKGPGCSPLRDAPEQDEMWH